MGVEPYREWRRLTQFGDRFLLARQYEEAIAYYQKAKVLSSSFPEQPELLGILCDRLGYAYVSQKAYAMAEAFYLESIPYWTACLGFHHPDLADTHLKLFELAMKQSQFDKAEKALYRAMDCNQPRAMHSLDPMRIQLDLKSFAFYSQTQDTDSLQPILSRIQEYHHALLHNSDHAYYSSRFLLALFYARKEELTQSYTLFLHSASLLETFLATNPPRHAELVLLSNIHNNLGWLSYRMDHGPEAETYLNMALSYYDRIYPTLVTQFIFPRMQDYLTCLMNYGTLLMKTGNQKAMNEVIAKLNQFKMSFNKPQCWQDGFIDCVSPFTQVY
jgi:tetratricopeptide (TPR) repeat protein